MEEGGEPMAQPERTRARAHPRVRAAVPFVLAAALLCAGAAQAADVADSFNDNREDPAIWGPDEVGGNGRLAETNRRLEFSVVSPTARDYRRRHLRWGRGRYDADWTVSLRVTNATRPRADNQYAAFGVSAVRCGHRGHEVFVELYASHLGGPPGRKGVFAEEWTNHASSGWAGTGGVSHDPSLSGRVRIDFDAAAKVLTASYALDGGPWTTLGSFGVAGAGGANGNAHWHMADGDRFCLGVFGYSRHMTPAGERLSGDSFRATGLARRRPRVGEPEAGP